VMGIAATSDATAYRVSCRHDGPSSIVWRQHKFEVGTPARLPRGFFLDNLLSGAANEEGFVDLHVQGCGDVGEAGEARGCVVGCFVALDLLNGHAKSGGDLRLAPSSGDAIVMRT
jgi:hypothetical protein